MLCEARLHQTYMAGVPHLRVLPEPWASDDKRAPEIINLPARGGTAVTSALATAYMAAAAAPNAKDLSSGDDRFKSCCLLPLFQSNDLDEHVSRTPLHVTLGLGTNYLKAVEARCAELDSVWAINVTDQVLTDEWLTAVTDVEMAKEAVAECERNLRSKEAGMAINLEKDAEAKRKGRVDASRADGRDIWVIEYRQYANEHKLLESSLKKLTAAVTAADKVEAGAREKILKLTPEGTGPFGTRFKKLLIALKISMKTYFGGTYIGPDLHKIFGVSDHIRMLCDTLKAGSFECPDGVTRFFGSDEEVRCTPHTSLGLLVAHLRMPDCRLTSSSRACDLASVRRAAPALQPQGAVVRARDRALAAARRRARDCICQGVPEDSAYTPRCTFCRCT